MLINNAAIVHGKSLLSLSAAEIEKGFRVNLLSHFHLLQAFLPSMLSNVEGGTVVTISSVLGQLGASQLSDYTAAKAGLIAMHASLRAELSAMARSSDAPPGVRNVKTILVKPGQLSTKLFEGVKTPSSFFGPVVTPEVLAAMIVNRVVCGETCVIALPLYASLIEWFAVLPYGMQEILRRVTGLDRAMEGFRRP